jgi:hypothetical protein
MLDDLWTTVNWLAVTIPFFVGAGAYGLTTDTWKWPAVLGLGVAAVIVAACFVGLYFLYPVVGFPAWMRWPHEWLG